MWNAITYVTSGLGLAAFIVSAGVFMYRRFLLERRKLISSAAESDRARLAEKTLTEFFNIDTSALSPRDQYKLALKQIDERARRFKHIVGLVLFFGILALIAFVIERISPIGRPGNQGPNASSVAERRARARPISANLVSWWTADGSVTADGRVDDSIGGNHGSLRGGAEFASTFSARLSA